MTIRFELYSVLTTGEGFYVEFELPFSQDVFDRILALPNSRNIRVS